MRFLNVKQRIFPALFAVSALLLCGCGAESEPSASAALTPSSTPALLIMAADAPATAEPLPAPTAVPTPAPSPTPVSDAALDAGALDAYFADTVIVGDSLSRNLNSYVLVLRETDPDCLGELRFLTAHNYSLKLASRNEVVDGESTMRYQGKAVTIATGLARMGAKRAFLLLGINDYVGFNMDKCLGYTQSIIDGIRAENPDIELVLESPMPVYWKYHSGGGRDYNLLLIQYGLRLQQLAEDNGCLYLDLYTPLADNTGSLPGAYCSDGSCHLNDAGNDIWIHTLRAFARSRLEAGLWSPDAANEEGGEAVTPVPSASAAPGN